MGRVVSGMEVRGEIESNQSSAQIQEGSLFGVENSEQSNLSLLLIIEMKVLRGSFRCWIGECGGRWLEVGVGAGTLDADALLFGPFSQQLVCGSLLPFEYNGPDCSNLIDVGAFGQPLGIFFDLCNVVLTVAGLLDMNGGELGVKV